MPVHGRRGFGFARPTPSRARLAPALGRGVAALNPTFVGLLSASLTLGHSIGVFAVVAYGIMIAAALALPETMGRELTAEA
jgi:hypothetical protein